MSKVKTIVCSLLLVIIIASIATAQELKGDDAQENLFKIGEASAASGVVRKFDNRYEGIKGSPFYFNSWSEGIVITNSDEKSVFTNMKYNAYEDELIVMTSNSGQFYFPKRKIKSFILEETQTGLSIPFSLLPHFKKHDEFQFYRVIFDGNIVLLEYTKVIFEKADFEGGYSNDKRYDEFKKYSNVYYFSKGMKQPLKLKGTANGISKIFPDHNVSIKQFIGENDFDLKSYQDLIEIFEYYQNIDMQ